MKLLEFVFHSFWRFIGSLIIFCTAGMILVETVKAFMPKRKIIVNGVTITKDIETVVEEVEEIAEDHE